MSKARTFIEQCISGEALTDDVEEFVERWHAGTDPRELHEYLGMSWREYSLWMTEPDILPHIVTAHKQRVPLANLITNAQDLALAARFKSPTQTAKVLAWLRRQGKIK